jgi:hypothetical protein
MADLAGNQDEKPNLCPWQQEHAEKDDFSH